MKQMFMFVILCILVLVNPLAADDYDYGGTLGEGEQLGVMRSDDLGKTWKFIGHAGFLANGSKSLGLLPVDISPVAIDGGVALYFFDLQSIDPSKIHVFYRSVSSDGVHFTKPEAVLKSSNSILDPFFLKRANVPIKNYYLAYVHVPGGADIYTSNDGMSFTFAANLPGARTPGALELPGQGVRVFGCDGPGISSWTSTDGISKFTKDPGDRLFPVVGTGTVLGDPHPIPLRAGGYFPNGHPKNGYVMVYKVSNTIHPRYDVAYLATSPDGLAWAKTNVPIATGSVPSIVELADGVLLVYYVVFPVLP
jgi:hypothetical protein